MNMTSSASPELVVIAASSGENLKLAQRFVDAATAKDVSADLIDLTTIDLPLFTPRIQEAGAGDGLPPLQKKLHAAPRWVICAPEYNGSIPPVLSNAIAWLSVLDEDFRSLFNGKSMAIATFSGGGGMELLGSLRTQLSHLGADLLGRQLLSNYGKPPKDESINDLLDRLLQRSPLEL